MRVEIRSAYGTASYGPATPRAITTGVLTAAELSSARAQRARAVDEAAAEVVELARRLRPVPARTATTTSDVRLNLATESTAAAKRSTAEVNTTPTSYGPRRPQWADGSTSTPTISGTYTGPIDTTWTATVTQVSFLGLGNYKIHVQNSAGTTVRDLTLNGGNPAGTYALANGLSLTLTSGSLRLNDTFTVDVRAAVPTSLNPTKPLNGTFDNAPRFDAGYTPGAGSFTVNGVLISVAANDTVNAVLARITASAAGVDASYDSATDKVVLRARQAGAAGQINLGNDTSGLGAALKLTGAPLEPGTDPDADRPLNQVARFAGVTNGTLTINGTAVSVNPATDTLRAVLARVNAQTNVTAQLIAGDQFAAFTARDAGTSLSLSDTSGLLDALGISRRQAPGAAARSSSASVRTELAKALGTLRNAVQAAWNGGDSDTRRDLREALTVRSEQAGLAGDLIGVSVKGTELVFGDWSANDAYQRLAARTRASGRLLNGASGSTDDGLAERVGYAARRSALRDGLFL